MPKDKPQKKGKPLAKELARPLGKSGQVVGKSATHWIIKKKKQWVTVKRSKAADPFYSKIAGNQRAAGKVTIERRRGKTKGGTDDGGYNILGEG